MERSSASTTAGELADEASDRRGVLMQAVLKREAAAGTQRLGGGFLQIGTGIDQAAGAEVDRQLSWSLGAEPLLQQPPEAVADVVSTWAALIAVSGRQRIEPMRHQGREAGVPA